MKMRVRMGAHVLYINTNRGYKLKLYATHTYTWMWLKKNMIITIDDLARRRKSIFVPTADANMDKGAIYDYTFDAPKLKNLLKSQRTG